MSRREIYLILLRIKVKMSMAGRTDHMKVSNFGHFRLESKF